MWLETVHQSEDHAEKCPTCGGGVQRRTYSEVHAGSLIFHGERVDFRGIPRADFADPIVLDPLTQYFDGGLYRLWPSEKYLARGGKRLHRDVWEGAFGPIPKGCHIHHRDSNTKHNALSNLELLPASQHLAATWKKYRGGKFAHFSEKAKVAAAAWHRSEEGRLWHRRHAQRGQYWTKWKRIDKVCPFCKEHFQGLDRKSGHTQIYCSENCKMASYRARKRLARNG